MCKELGNLNDAILNFLKGEEFLVRLKSLINQEKNEMVPDDRYCFHLANDALQRDPIYKQAELLVNIENPTPYILLFCLERYIEVDSRASAIREGLNQLVDLQKQGLH
jgi:hypothetical protein